MEKVKHFFLFDRRLPILGVLFLLLGCSSRQPPPPEIPLDQRVYVDSLVPVAPTTRIGEGPLLLSQFNSLEEFLSVVEIAFTGTKRRPEVVLTHTTPNQEVVSKLKMGVSQYDLQYAFKGNQYDKIRLAFTSTYVLWNRYDLLRIELLARWRFYLFGEGDVAFYDLASSMVDHIDPVDRAPMTEADLSEKGYLNTFNHVVSQAILTSVFSERMADFISDIHERYRMPQLTTGTFSKEQMNDHDNGPLDNYLDLINNEWGQEWGKVLKEKYQLNRQTRWTPTLLSNYLNDLQLFHAKVYHIGFKPFLPSDEVILRYTYKLNEVMLNYTEVYKNYR